MREETKRTLAETWTAGLSEDGCDLVYLDKEVIAQFWRGTETDTSGSAQLAACAPEMARLLLDAEWGGMDGNRECCCPWCEVSTDGYTVDPPHAIDCRWLALMVKAGLR